MIVHFLTLLVLTPYVYLGQLWWIFSFFYTVYAPFLLQSSKLKTFEQMQTIGVDSLAIVILTGASSGAVFSFKQSYFGLKRFGLPIIISIGWLLCH